MDIKLTYNDDKKGKCYSHFVSFADFNGENLCEITSSSVFGQGASYEEAYTEFVKRYCELVDALNEFKTKLIEGESPIIVDSMGKPT